MEEVNCSTGMASAGCGAVYVFCLAADQVARISELREILELAAAAAAMKRNHPLLVARMTEILRRMRKAYDAGNNVGYRTLDGELRQTIIDLCGNPYIRDAYGPIGFRIQALRSRLSDEAGLNQLSFRDHCEILKLIKAGEVAALQKLMRAHIRETARSYLEVLGRRIAIGKEATTDMAIAPASAAMRKSRASGRASDSAQARSNP